MNIKQVKKMFKAVGFEVAKLKREKEAFFDLKNLQSGEFRKLTPKECWRLMGFEDADFEKAESLRRLEKDVKLHISVQASKILMFSC